jgi:hypothetical protein
MDKKDTKKDEKDVKLEDKKEEVKVEEKFDPFLGKPHYFLYSSLLLNSN